MGPARFHCATLLGYWLRKNIKINFVTHVKLCHQFCGLWAHAKLPMTFRVHSPALHIPIAPPSTKCIVINACGADATAWKSRRIIDGRRIFCSQNPRRWSFEVDRRKRGREERDIANEFNVIMKGGSGNGSLGPFEVTRNEISNGWWGQWKLVFRLGKKCLATCN